MKLKLGLGQLLVEGGEPQRNLNRACHLIEQSAQQNCHIVLLPECLDLGWTHPSSLSEAQPIPGIYSEKLCRAAQEFQVFVCAGLTEKSGQKIFNSAVLIDKEGTIILKYRKINELECAQHIYSIGQSLSVIETPYGVIGVNICSDNYINSLEIGHALARMGAQIILSPCSWTVNFGELENNNPYHAKWLMPYKILAELYDLVIAGATSVGTIVGGIYEGKKMVGCSLVVDKKGILTQGRYNEFASDLVTVEVCVPERIAKGTAIGEMLKKKGYYQGDMYPSRVETPPQ